MATFKSLKSLKTPLLSSLAAKTSARSCITTYPAASYSSVTVEGIKPHKLDFNDVKEAYKSKSTGDLLLSIAVFQLCSVKPLVDRSEAIVRFSRKVFGDTLVAAVMKPTLFNYFCAGEDGETIKPTIAHLAKYNVGAILDYAAEPDLELSDDVPATTKLDSIYDDSVEKYCTLNRNLYLEAINTTARATKGGFAAIKMTALANPILLERVSIALTVFREAYAVMAEVNGVAATAPLSQIQFSKGLKHVFSGLTDAQVTAVYTTLSQYNADGTVGYDDWFHGLSLESVLEVMSHASPGTPLSTYAHKATKNACMLNEDDVLHIKSTLARVDSVFALSVQQRVHTMMDAEHSYFQVFIDYVVLEHQRKYNQPRNGVVDGFVWSTYQCYLRDSHARVVRDLDRSRKEGWVWCAKTVRGAYMNTERRVANEQGYQSPIFDSIEETHANYNRCVQYIITHLDHARLLVASHNQHSVELATDSIIKAGMDPRSCGVYFGQLLGMADHLTFILGQNNFAANKYVPYGRVMEVLPYLIRRAQENSNMLGGVGHERRMLWKELMRRLTHSQ